MRRTISLLTVAALYSCFAIVAAAADAAPKIRVLLIGGDDVSAHNAREICDATRDVLLKSGKFDVRVCEDPMILESEAALKSYDAVAFVMYTAKTPMISDKAKENLLGFVKAGKGFYVQHLASASFAKWPAFGELCGRFWVMGSSGHGPRSVFEAKIAKQDHPITKGLKNFKIDDELYAKLQGSGEMDVLVEADSDWSKKTEPLVFARSYGKGRSVHNAFGHDGKVIGEANVAKLVCRGVEWAATGKVSE
jgi:type 1 glutamine amidotransferase